MKKISAVVAFASMMIMVLAADLSARQVTTATPVNSGSTEDQYLSNVLNDVFSGTNSTFGARFVDKFLDPEAEALAKANTLGALMGHPTSYPCIKSGTLPGFIIGATGGMTMGLSENVNLDVAGQQVNFPLAAGVVGWNMFGGLNLGLWGLGLPNVDVLVHSGGGSMNRDFGKYSIEGSSQRGGFLVRYHVINPISLVLVKFLGLSVGAGYSYQHVDFTLNRKSTTTMDLSQAFTAYGATTQIPGSMTWTSKQSIGFETHSNVFPVQVHTGINLLWILNLHAGMGYAFATGDTWVGYKNQGTFTGTISGNTAASNLKIDYTGKAKAENSLYAFGGGEIKILMFHIVVEAMVKMDDFNKIGDVYGLQLALNFKW